MFNQAARHFLRRLFPPAGGGGAGIAAKTGTLLVCPMAPRVKGLHLMRDLSFDGLSLAFLKNLEKITFASSVEKRSPGSPPAAAAAAASSASDGAATQLTQQEV